MDPPRGAVLHPRGEPPRENGDLGTADPARPGGGRTVSRRAGDGRGDRLHLLRRHLRLRPRRHGGAGGDPHPGDGGGGVRPALRGGPDGRGRRHRHHHPAVDRPRDLRRGGQRLHLEAVHRRDPAGDPGRPLPVRRLVPSLREGPEHPAGKAGVPSGDRRGVQGRRVGSARPPHHPRRHLRRHLHRHGGGHRRGRLRRDRRLLHPPGPEALRPAGDPDRHRASPRGW